MKKCEEDKQLGEVHKPNAKSNMFVLLKTKMRVKD